jgi:HSP20 family protein
MSERRRRRSIFDIFDELMREFEEEFEDLMKSFSSEYGRVRPYVYGFRITIGPDGKPKIEEFGNVKRVGIKPRIVEEMEPLVDVIEEDDKVKVVAEMPGVEKEKINVRATEDTLIIKGSNANRKYYKEVKLPARVKPETAKATYRNGVLEVVIEKHEKKGGGVEVKID